MCSELEPKDRKTRTRLTGKQEMFAQAFVETGNASEAYRHAYNVRETTKAESVWQSASKLLANPKVASRVSELKALHLRRHETTVDDLMVEFDENRMLAIRNLQISAANTATMGKARLQGLDRGAARSNEPESNPKTTLSDYELARRLASLLQSYVARKY